MDPFSITVGAVALVETANSVAGVLLDRYRSYSSAPKAMAEIASQITFCAGLVDVFAKSVDGTRRQYPKKFQEDATCLVSQCREIFKDIQALISDGARSPDYARRLKYAFKDEKKIKKHQESLKQVQHMFMFMTTCWMYQLPSMEATTNASVVPTGSLRGMMQQQIPVQINVPGGGAGRSQSIAYEATITLKLIDMPQVASLVGSGKRRERMGAKEKENLENMYASPYFSLSLLRPVRRGVKETTRSRSSGKASDEFDIPPRGQANREVDFLLTKWFKEDARGSEYDDEYDECEYGSSPPSSPSISRPRAPNDGYPPSASSTRPSSSHGGYIIYTPPPPSPHDWDWKCDGCAGKFRFRDGNRYKCLDCRNYDLCYDCFGETNHRHHPSRFEQRGG